VGLGHPRRRLGAMAETEKHQRLRPQMASFRQLMI
jgi:hypothetical protein